MEEKNEQRPLILEIEDTKQEMIYVVNKAIQRGLPCYIVNMIFDGICSQVQEGAKSELAMARQVGVTETTSTIQND